MKNINNNQQELVQYLQQQIRTTKDSKQILSSMKKITSDYNLIFASNELNIDQKSTAVSVPLDYYFLM